MSRVSLTVNGAPGSADVEGRTLLVQLLREKLGLTGTHVGCDTSQCGACVVHVDGESVKSCTMLAVQADGAKVTTIEGMARRRHAAPDAGGLPRESRPAMRLLHPGHGHERDRPGEAQPEPSETEIREGLEGNICRCTGYHNIVKAIQAGAPRWDAEGGDRPWTQDGIGAPCAARRTSASSPVAATTPTTSTGPARPTPISCARPTPMPKIRQDRQARRQGGARRRRRVHRRRRRRGQDRRTALRLADPNTKTAARWRSRRTRRWSPRRSPCRRSGRRGHRRNPGPGQGCGRADQGRLQGTAGRRRPATRSRRGAPKVHDDGAGQRLLRLAYRRQGATDAAFAKAAHVVKYDLVNNRLIPNAMEPRAAVGDYDPAAAITRSTRPARTRM